jgi:8-hydroxy-5-deazaflavin:NADPH oxidoreductase
VRVAIVGGTGPFGRALATKLRGAGYDVVLGSREEQRAAEAAAELGVEGALNADAVASADLVVLTTKAEGALATARELRTAIGSTPLLSVASELRRTQHGLVPRASASSIAQELQTELEGPVVAGLHSLAASNLAEDEPDEDALVCGDDADAKALALELAGEITGGRAFDAGPLENARVLEGLTAVIVNLNKRYRGHAGLRITGLP